ncbi:MAG: hypothetical protein QOF30_2865 [Acidimicrobiaceae bacterium]|nr:hypothetical protein [Acidimicrobiaceae bacterium]
MKVLYILGTQRGGTTIVGRVLGLVPGAVYAGEVRRLWEFGVGPDRTCGCGELLVDCPVWSVVLRRVRAAGIDPASVSAWQEEVVPVEGSWRTSRAMRRPHDGHLSFTGYAGAMAATYHGLAEAYGVDVVIDNSKLPADGAFLAHVTGVEASYVHVVRDARGVVASQLRRRSPSSPARRSLDATMLAASWVMRHTRSEQFDPEHLLRVRYEDFVADPSATMAGVCRLLGLPQVELASGPFQLPAVHTPRGPNPALTTMLIEDMSWKNELSRFERGLIGTLTAPWLVRHGYLKRNR